MNNPRRYDGVEMVALKTKTPLGRKVRALPETRVSPTTFGPTDNNLKSRLWKDSVSPYYVFHVC
jgi:hypothetical protein